jgi:hypothetical protein
MERSALRAVSHIANYLFAKLASFPQVNYEPMSSSTPSALRAFLNYWGENIRTAREKHDAVMFFITFCLLVAGLVGMSAGADFSMFDASASRIGLFCLWACGLSFTGWCLIWWPFRRHQQILKQHEQAVTELREDNGQLQSDLRNQINASERTEYERINRDATRWGLGELLAKLQSQWKTIDQIGDWAYHSERGKPELEKTNQLIQRTHIFLQKNVGNDAAALFGAACIGSSADDFPTQKAWHLHALAEHIKELKAIITRYQGEAR